jgi:hypothetical protein
MAVALHLPVAAPRAGSRRLARRRRRYADALERTVPAARWPAPAGRLTSAVPLRRKDVLANRALILQLACRVREAADAPASALDPVRRLLTEGAGPLYEASEPGTLRDAVLAAMLALEHDGSRTP